jgi:hypothetical protein
MTLLDVEQPSPPPSPAGVPGRRRALGIAAGVLVLAVLGTGIGADSYYSSVPEPAEFPRVGHAVADVRELPLPVLNAFVAAVDPDLYTDPFRPWSGSLITREYVVYAAQDGDADDLRIGVMADKLEDRYTHVDILGFYLNTALFGRDMRGIESAAQSYFGKPASRLTLAEAAVLAAQLSPDATDARTAWGRVLDTMVQRGWLSHDERALVTYPTVKGR